MLPGPLTITYIGGPTILLELAGLRLLTVKAAHTFANAVIVPIPFEDWAHFSEGREDVARAFTGAKLDHRHAQHIVIKEPSCRILQLISMF